nr:ABC transporter permease subunit [Pseudoroseomonas deserti]
MLLRLRHPLLRYAARRLLLVPPTLLAILIINVGVTQLAPGGPVEHLIAQLTPGNDDSGGAERVLGAPTALAPDLDPTMRYRGAERLDAATIAEIERMFGFDRPPLERFWLMLKRFLSFDLGRSLFLDRPVAELLWQRLPVSASLGAWSTFLTYGIALPLGIILAVRRGTGLDRGATFAIALAHAVPGVVVAVALLVLFAGGRVFAWFPTEGLVSAHWQDLSWGARILDWLWHLALPVTALVLGGFASLALMTRSLFLEEIGKPYVQLALAKGLAGRRVLFRHVFPNAMLVILAGLPSALIGLLFGGGLLVEVVFGLDGIGLLGFEAISSRDYPVIFGTLWLFTLLGLVLHLAGDLLAAALDPRIGFQAAARG